MEPNIITDFNQLVTHWIGGSRTEVPLWDKELQAISGENVRYFYIEWLNHEKYGMVSGKKSRYALKAGK